MEFDPIKVFAIAGFIMALGTGIGQIVSNMRKSPETSNESDQKYIYALDQMVEKLQNLSGQYFDAIRHVSEALDRLVASANASFGSISIEHQNSRKETQEIRESQIQLERELARIRDESLSRHNDMGQRLSYAITSLEDIKRRQEVILDAVNQAMSRQKNQG